MSELEKFKKCMSEECFRWAIAACMEIKRDYWHCYGECLGVSAVRHEIIEDNCHELCTEEVLRKHNFSRQAIKECLII